MKAIPTRRLFLLFVGVFLFSLGGFFNPFLFFAGFVLDGFLLLIVLFEFITIKNAYSWEVDLLLPPIFSIGREREVCLFVSNRSERAIVLTCFLDLPVYFEGEHVTETLRIEANRSARFFWRLKCFRRGRYAFEALYLVFLTPMKLLQVSFKKPIDLKTDVLPDIKMLNQYIRLMRLNRSLVEGRHVNRYMGTGTELNYLREYHADDPFKAIDWKASSRTGKPMVKVFKNESAGSVYFLIDCGRMMLSEAKGLSALDHAVNAILMLSYLIIRSGDSVGMIAFDDHIIGELPPVRGKAAIQKILLFITRLQPSSAQSNYAHAFSHLRKKIKKRSMIMTVTDMMDDINTTVLNRSLTYFNRRHLAVLVLLKDVVLEDILNQDMAFSSFSDEEKQSAASNIYVTAGVKDMVMRRAAAIERLKKNGIGVLDLLPESLTPEMINSYFQAKAANLL